MNGKNWKNSLLFIIFLKFGLTVQTAWAAGRAPYPFATGGIPGTPTRYLENSPLAELKPPEDHLTSKIDFLRNKNRLNHPVIHYAQVSVPDPLDLCPIDDAAADLKEAIESLTHETSLAVKKIKDATAESCQVLQNRLTSLQNNFSSAVTNQFVASSAIASSAGQYQINDATQKATAVNQLFWLTSDLFQNQCIETMDQRVVVQKLLGQVITFGGLFAGGWTGIAAAAGGQIIGNLPLFSRAIDEAIDALKEDEERKSRLSFLCLFRQISKTSCMLYTPRTERFVNGLDLQFKVGPGKTTFDSLAEIHDHHPKLLEDVQLLSTLQKKFEKLNAYFNLELLKNGSLDIFGQIKNICASPSDLQFLSAPPIHPQAIWTALDHLQNVCNDLSQYDYPDEAKEGYATLIQNSYDPLNRLTQYYHALIQDKDDPVKSYIAKTWESHEFLTSLKKSILQQQDPFKGNEIRSDFLDLTQKLGDTIALESFSKLMKRNHRKLTQRAWLEPAIHSGSPAHSERIRSNSLISMLKACQTLDPTLACLYVDPFATTQIQKEWVHQCVGPSSPLCRNTLKRKEKAALLQDNPQFIAYFDSLCGA